MDVDMFLIFDGDIEGDTLDAQYADDHAIDVLAWSWGMSQPAGDVSGAGRRRSRVSLQDISVTKYLDSASTAIMGHCSTGKHIPSARLIVRASGRNPIEVLVIEMTNVFITSLSTGGSGGEDRLTENISLGFATVAVTYTGRQPDGAAGKKHEFSWDIVAGA